MFKELKELFAAREVLNNLVGTDLKLRFRRSLLGYAWSLLYPLMTMALLALVFHKLVRSGTPQEYILYVFAGLVPWNFFVTSCQSCGVSILNNEALLKKVYLPKIVFPVAVLFARFVDFLFNLGALFIIVSFVAFKPSMALLALPLALLILFLFTAGIATALSAVTVYVRDAVHLTSVLLQILFYATPIIYPESFWSELSYKHWFEINPMLHIVRLFHSILAHGMLPTTQQWAIAAGLAIVSVTFGYALYARLSRNLIFRL